jgi:hypothetical protein
MNHLIFREGETMFLPGSIDIFQGCDATVDAVPSYRYHQPGFLVSASIERS